MAVRFEHPRDVRFACTRCGDCCRTFEILLSQDEVERLSAIDWTAREERLVGVEVTAPIRTLAGRRRLARRADGACVFLDDGSRCSLHTHLGADSKPLLCRLYPFAFRPMGERIAIDVSFACRSVGLGDGDPLERQIPEWSRLVQERDPSQGPLLLRPSVTISPDLVWELEHHLIELLADESMDLFDRIRCALQLGRLGTTGPAAAMGKLWQALARGVPLQVRREPNEATMDKTQTSVFRQWLYLALNPPPPELAAQPRDLQERTKREVEKAADRYRAQSGKPHLSGRELAVTFADIDRVSATPFRGAVAEPLAAYLRAKILGQKFLKAGLGEMPFSEAVPKLFLVAPMTIWTAKALAADRGSGRVEEADVRQALRLIDRTFGQIPTSLLPPKQAKAFDFVMIETEIVEAAMNDLLRFTA